MENKIKLDLPIEPEIGVGNIKLLESMVHLRHLVLSDLDQITPDDSEQGNWICKFDFPDWVHFSYRGILKATVNICNGLIVRIEVAEGYKGLLWNSIGIGSSVEELISIKPDAFPDEELIIVGDDFGVQFTIDHDGEIWDIEEVRSNKITKIVICAHEFQSLPINADRLPSSWVDRIESAIR